MATAIAKRAEAAPILLDPVFEDAAVRFMLDDIGIDLLDPVAQKNLRLYINTVKNVESSGGKNTIAKTQKSGRPGARGDYQWFPQRFQEDLNAAILFHSKAGSPTPDWIKAAKKHGDPVKLSSTQQEQLFLLSLYRFPGTNAQIKAISEGDLAEGRALYQERWHGGKPETEGGTLSASEWKAHQAQVDKYFNPAIEKAETVTSVTPKDPLKQRMADRQIEAVSDYDSVLQEAMPVSISGETEKKITERLNKINVTAQRRDPELFPVNVTAQRRDLDMGTMSLSAAMQERPEFAYPPLEEVTVDAQRRQPVLLSEKLTTKLNDRLKEITVSAKRIEPDMAARSLEAAKRERPEFAYPPLEEVTVTAQRRAPERVLPADMYRSDGSVKSKRGFLGPLIGDDGRTMTEFSIGVQIDGKETEIPSMVPGLTDSEINSIKSGVVPESAQVKAKVHAVKRIAEGKSPFYQDGEEIKKEPTTPDTTSTGYRVPDSVVQRRKRLDEIKAETYKGVLREVAGGISFQSADEIEAFAASQINGTSYYHEKERINKEREKFKRYNPVSAIAAETLGAIPGGIASTKALVSMGVIQLPVIGAIETGTYGFNSGESIEERLIFGTSGTAIGAVGGKLFEKIFSPSLVKSSTDVDGLNNLQADALQAELSSQKILTAPANMTDDEVVTQLLIRESEFLSDVIGRQGAKADEIGNTLLRLSQFARDMGVQPAQINRVLNNNKIRELTRLPKDVFEDPYALNAFRQDLLDNTAGRLGVDVARTIPEAQSAIVKFRRFASPLATLAETVVGPAFSARIIRGMNRVVRQQAQLDDLWKGMEQLRSLADDVKFNDLMLDAVNATNIGQKAATKAFNQAKKYADDKIGAGAGDRLQKFMDDSLEFNARYRREVTAGELSPIWMHSSTKAAAEDVSLRVNRQRAAAKTEDAASKDRLRRSMEEERAKPLDEQREYANIFDSHWRWQRETLTRMELGKQLGLRTSGKPIFEESYENLPKKLQKAVDDEKMTLLEASAYNTLTSSLKKKVDSKKLDVFEAAAQMEQKSFKLFDEKVINETLKREGYSDVQIKNAIEILDDLGVNAQRGMSQELDVIRSLGYVGTIANPYGALMNVHDLFNAAFEFGVGNVLRSVFDKGGVRFTAQEMGLAQQVYGEFVRKATRGDKTLLGVEFIDRIAKGSSDLLDWSMKASGFAGLDRFGKGKIMGASFKKAKQDIDSGVFDTKWKDTFSRGELDQLRRDIASNNTQSELVRDLVMFDLFRLQPINAAAQTSFGLANPNARLFYMLKGFAIKQFDLMERRIFREWQQGNKKQALENAMKYLVISGGGYGVVNEARQVIKGEAPDPEEAAVGALYQLGSVLTFGAMGANDYGYAKFMEDPANAMMVNIFPPMSATLPAAVLEDVADAFTKGDPLPDETIYALPVVGKIIKGAVD